MKKEEQVFLDLGSFFQYKNFVKQIAAGDFLTKYCRFNSRSKLNIFKMFENFIT